MDWNLAIAINRTALKRILAMLVAMAGLPVPLCKEESFYENCSSTIW